MLCSKCHNKHDVTYYPGTKVFPTVEEHVDVINNVTVLNRDHCNGFDLELYYEFKEETPVVLYRIIVDYGRMGADDDRFSRLEEKDVPRMIDILETNYKLFAVTLIKPAHDEDDVAHFVAIFYTNDGDYLYDGLRTSLRRLNSKFTLGFVTTAYYVPAPT